MVKAVEVTDSVIVDQLNERTEQEFDVIDDQTDFRYGEISYKSPKICWCRIGVIVEISRLLH